MQLLPTSFRALEADLGLSPTTLAASALMQSLTCSYGFQIVEIGERGPPCPHQPLPWIKSTLKIARF